MKGWRRSKKIALIDLIVCWKHNWPDCPLEVIELQNVAQIWKAGGNRK